MTSACSSRRPIRGDASGVESCAWRAFNRSAPPAVRCALATALGAWLVAPAGCSRQGSEGPPPAATAPAAGRAAIVSHGHINVVLDLWKAGRKEEAVGELLRLTASEAPAESFRPSNLSEDQFVAMFKQVSEQEAERLRSDLADRCTSLLQILREMNRRGMAAADAGDLAEAERFFSCLKRVAHANQGPESMLTKIVNQVGQGAAKWADEGFTKLRALQTAGAQAN